MLKYLFLVIGLVGCGADINEENYYMDIQKAGRTGGWQVNGSLFSGNVKRIIPPAPAVAFNVDAPLKTVHAQADFPVAGYYTIQFGIDASTQELPTDAPPNGIFDCIADITWSVEGNHIKRRISVGNGATISGAGAGVKVDVTDRTSVTVYGATNVGRNYKVSVQITPGTRPSEERPPTLIAEDATGSPVFTVAPGATTNVDIPASAGANSVNIAVVASPLALITETDANIIIGSSLAPLKQYFPGDPTQWVPIPPGSTIVQLVNNFPALGPNLIFVVTFGIEG